MQKIYEKLEGVLCTKFPFKEERDEIVTRSGEMVLMETSEEVLRRLGDDGKRIIYANLINTDEITKAMDFAESEGINVEEIFEKKSIEITSLVFQM